MAKFNMIAVVMLITLGIVTARSPALSPIPPSFTNSPPPSPSPSPAPSHTSTPPPSPSPVKSAPAPSPTKSSPAPSPVESAPTPSPVKSAPTPSPISSPPSQSPVLSPSLSPAGAPEQNSGATYGKGSIGSIVVAGALAVALVV